MTVGRGQVVAFTARWEALVTQMAEHEISVNGVRTCEIWIEPGFRGRQN
jgi:hypothetical protein